MGQAAGTTAPVGRRIIERPRLLKLLDEATARTILLVAPAGYGKTTLARQWAQRHQNVYWYSAGPGSSDIAELAIGLANAVAAAAPELRSYSEQLIRTLSNPRESARDLAEGIADVLGTRLTSATIVIDDYHLITPDPAAAAFPRLLQDRLGFRLIAVSRARPTWATARLKIYGELSEVTAGALALTAEETEAVLGNKGARSAYIVELARGWPAVIGLAAHTELGPVNAADDPTATAFRFVAEELFRNTKPRVRERLLTLALLPDLSRDLVSAAIDADPDAVVEEAVASGLANGNEETPEVHPLVREYLWTKVAASAPHVRRARQAVVLSVRHGRWDHAFALIDRFQLTDLLGDFLEAAFTPLVASGRIATLEGIAAYAQAHSPGVSQVAQLIDAELAFRNGRFALAEAIARRVAEDSPKDAWYASHAWWVAGQAAQLSFQDQRAANYFTRARDTARQDDDVRDALWGLVMTLTQAESPSATDAIEELHGRRYTSPVDLVRSAGADLFSQRGSRLRSDIDVDEALHALPAVNDPRVRSGFLNSYSYHLILTGRYSEANDAARSMDREADSYRLTWAKPHATWSLAAASVGRRQFRTAAQLLQTVEAAGDELNYGQLVLNAACLRARLLLALQRPNDALSALVVADTTTANRAMQGEHLGTRALVSAVLGDASAAEDDADAALEQTTFVEAKAYVACSRAVLADRGRGPQTAATTALAEAYELGAWDAIVSAIRAWPTLLRHLVAVAPFEDVVRLLRSSSDFDLARRNKIDIGRRQATGGTAALSAREAEVLDLVREGLTNRDIARALFISESTVKVHVQHILDKTGSRSRAEAVAKTSDES